MEKVKAANQIRFYMCQYCRRTFSDMQRLTCHKKEVHLEDIAKRKQLEKEKLSMRTLPQNSTTNGTGTSNTRPDPNSELELPTNSSSQEKAEDSQDQKSEPLPAPQIT